MGKHSRLGMQHDKRLLIAMCHLCAAMQSHASSVGVSGSPCALLACLLLASH